MQQRDQVGEVVVVCAGRQRGFQSALGVAGQGSTEEGVERLSDVGDSG